MTVVGHDPYRAHVPGSVAPSAPAASRPGPEGDETPESVVDLLAGWIGDDVGRFHHALLTVDALAGV